MRRTLCRLVPLAGLLCSGLTASAQTNAPATPAVGVSRQILVFAPGPTLPATLATWAERVKREWLSLLELPDRWRDTIVLVVQPQAESAGPPVQLGIFQVGPLVKYEIRLRYPPPIEPLDLARALVHALSLELANRERPAGASTNWPSATIPLWFREGLTQILLGDTDRQLAVARRGTEARRAATAAELMTVTDLPADPAARELFQANAWLFTEGLRRLPAGARRFQQFHAALAHGQRPDLAFQLVYGDVFADPVALEKWWNLQQSRLAYIRPPQNYSAAETGRRLDAALTLTTETPFRQLDRHAEQRWLKQLLPLRIRELELLYVRAHPLYRPVILAYRDAAVWLAEEKLSRFRRAVRLADERRAELHRQLREIGAFVDSVERRANAAARAQLTEDWFRTLEAADQFDQHRRNPIRDYLDQFEQSRGDVPTTSPESW